jgi:hypothetical protein
MRFLLGAGGECAAADAPRSSEIRACALHLFE